MHLCHSRELHDETTSSIYTLLSSAQTNESIAEALVDLIGLDKIHLIPEILQYRSELLDKVLNSLLVSSRMTLYHHQIGSLMGQHTTGSLRANENVTKQDRHRKYEDSGIKLEGTELYKGHDITISLTRAKQRMEDTLRVNAARPLFSKTAVNI